MEPKEYEIIYVSGDVEQRDFVHACNIKHAVDLMYWKFGTDLNIISVKVWK